MHYALRIKNSYALENLRIKKIIANCELEKLRITNYALRIEK